MQDDEDDDPLDTLFKDIDNIKTEPKDNDTPENAPEVLKDGELGRNARKLWREMRIKQWEEERKRKEDLENRNRPRRSKKVDLTQEEKELRKEGITFTNTPTFYYVIVHLELTYSYGHNNYSQ